jgi:signal transduction histidine kinase
MSRTDAAQKQLDVTRQYVREGLADARQSIWALRTQDAGETTLPVKLRRLVEAAGSGALAARCSVFGAYRPLPAETEQELLRVAQEAIHNVKKHAAATELMVELEYGPAAILLQVRDNGRGGVIDMQDGSAAGHFGLTGMRERAAAIGGTLNVISAPGEGTTIRLEAPAPEAVKELR